MDKTTSQQVPFTQPVSPAPQVVVTPSSSPNRKRMLTIIIILLLIVAIPPTIYFLNQQQIFKQRAAEIQVDPNAIASVNGKNIFMADVDAVVKQTYEDTNVDASIKSKALETLIERRILDDESQKLSVTVSDSEIQADEAINSNPTYFNEETKYKLLKEKVLKANVKYIEGYVVGFWLPPTDYGKLSPETEVEVARQRPQSQAVLTAIEEQMKAGSEPSEVAKKIYSDYPSFQSIISINGYSLKKNLGKDELFSRPRVYTKKDDTGNSFYNTLFSMKPGEIRQVLGEKNSGGHVIKVTGRNDGTEETYEEWLRNKKSTSVKIYKQL